MLEQFDWNCKTCAKLAMRRSPDQPRNAELAHACFTWDASRVGEASLWKSNVLLLSAGCLLRRRCVLVEIKHFGGDMPCVGQFLKQSRIIYLAAWNNEPCCPSSGINWGFVPTLHEPIVVRG